MGSEVIRAITSTEGEPGNEAMYCSYITPIDGMKCSEIGYIPVSTLILCCVQNAESRRVFFFLKILHYVITLHSTDRSP